jgi:catechol 2,3-dioxygenase-like lactoylglutathione lyase family enzyme
MIRIALTSVLVDDQAKALRFYTEVLGFVKRKDLAAGAYRWLTVVSPAAPDGVELALEPDAHPAAKAFKKAMFADEIPAASFAVDDIQAEYERLKQLGVKFRSRPTQAGPVTVALFDDTCGNLIQIAQS